MFANAKNYLLFYPKFLKRNNSKPYNMKKFIFFPLIFVLLISTSIRLSAQQEAQFSQNMFNILSFNPGFAGSSNQICMTMIARQQWMGLKETQYKDGAEPESFNVAPQTYLFNIEASVKPLRGALGAVVYSDKLGFESNTGFKLGYSYKRLIGPGQLGVGLMAGFLNKVIDYGKFNPKDEGDPLLVSNEQSAMIFDLSFGAFYRVENSWYAGLSSSQLLQTEASFPQAQGAPKLKRHYYLTGGYEYLIPSMPSFKLMPSVLIKTDFVSAQYDLSAIMLYESKIWGGLSYRVNDALVAMAGMNIMDDLKMGIAYDITTSAIGSQGRSFGSTELFINYCFEIKYTPPVTIYKNVRFFEY